MTSTQPQSRLRRTRFVCISDTHNFTPKLPKGDVLIHAGDLTNRGTFTELSKAVQWLEKADFEAKIVVAGNHDITLDPDFYAEHGANFHNQNPESPEACLALLTSSPTITYLNHASTTIHLSSLDGPQTTFSIFGSPYSPRQHDGRNWAFQYPHLSSSASPSPPQASLSLSYPSASPSRNPEALWSDIPLNSDIVVTHTPPYHHLDQSTGCEALRRALRRVRPRLHVCGHVHGARGAECLKWDLGSSHVAFKEAGVKVWEDLSGPNSGNGNGTGKIALVDLTGRRWRVLENDGGDGDLDYGTPLRGNHGQDGINEEWAGASTSAAFSEDATRGIGGDRDQTARCDREAPCGRSGRRETCIVNCAIVGTNFPHAGGRRLNKPIVVDLDLPVWG